MALWLSRGMGVAGISGKLVEHAMRDQLLARLCSSSRLVVEDSCHGTCSPADLLLASQRGCVFGSMDHTRAAWLINKCACCRLLGLAPAAQAIVFDFYQAVLEHTLAVARKEGRFDDGITSVTGTSVTLASEPQAR